MSRFLLFSFSFLLLINFVYALDIGVSPPEIIFSDSEEQKCQEIKIISEEKMLFSLEDKWNTISNSRNPLFYTSVREKAGVVLDYEKQVIVNGKEYIRICLKSLKSGKKQGLVILESNSASLGVRIEVRSELEREELSLEVITGNAIRGEEVKENNFDFSSVVLFLIFSDFFLLIVLLALIFHLNRKRLSYLVTN